MSEAVVGLVESLKKDRTGLKLDNGKWYGGSKGLQLNKGDKVELSLDATNKDSFGNPSIAHIKVVQKAANPFNSGSYKGNNYGKPATAYKSSGNSDPDTQSRIARSHAITTAVAIFALQGKKTVTFKDITSLAEDIKAYTEGTAKTVATAPSKSASDTSFGDEDDD